jgi:GNAT superfamily N-acetyltransferase
VGCYLLELPERENRALGSCDLTVAPTARRRGTGTALLRHGAVQADAAGRTGLLGSARLGSGGEAFALAAGAGGGLIETRRILTVDDETPGRLARLRAAAEPHAAGYSLVSWAGPTAAADLDQVARLNDVMADAPREASVEAELWDSGRVRAAEKPMTATGSGLYSVAARHDDSGDLAALTQVTVWARRPGHAWQGLTAVDRPHRGRRLGLLVKMAMHQWLATALPGLRQVLTLNTQVNAHMITINEQLGFQVSDHFWNCELSVPAILAAAGRRWHSSAASDPGPVDRVTRPHGQKESPS